MLVLHRCRWQISARRRRSCCTCDCRCSCSSDKSIRRIAYRSVVVGHSLDRWRDSCRRVGRCSLFLRQSSIELTPRDRMLMHPQLGGCLLRRRQSDHLGVRSSGRAIVWRSVWQVVAIAVAAAAGASVEWSRVAPIVISHSQIPVCCARGVS